MVLCPQQLQPRQQLWRTHPVCSVLINETCFEYRKKYKPSVLVTNGASLSLLFCFMISFNPIYVVCNGYLWSRCRLCWFFWWALLPEVLMRSLSIEIAKGRKQKRIPWDILFLLLIYLIIKLTEFSPDWSVIRRLFHTADVVIYICICTTFVKCLSYQDRINAQASLRFCFKASATIIKPAK